MGIKVNLQTEGRKLSMVDIEEAIHTWDVDKFRELNPNFINETDLESYILMNYPKEKQKEILETQKMIETDRIVCGRVGIRYSEPNYTKSLAISAAACENKELYSSLFF